MYNRYIPQSDGTYRRSRIPDSPPRSNVSPQPQKAPSEPPAVQEASMQTAVTAVPPCQRLTTPVRPRQSRQSISRKDGDTSITAFLRQLLPKNFDTADLFVVLLLLLMSGDCAEDQNTALLTLALYLFM